MHIPRLRNVILYSVAYAAFVIYLRHRELADLKAKRIKRLQRLQQMLSPDKTNSRGKSTSYIPAWPSD